MSIEHIIIVVMEFALVICGIMLFMIAGFLAYDCCGGPDIFRLKEDVPDTPKMDFVKLEEKISG